MLSVFANRDQIVAKRNRYTLQSVPIEVISMLMAMPRDKVERDLIRRIQPLARRLRASANTAVASLGLSDATGWALLQMHRSGPEASQASVAAALEISAPSLVRLLRQLERRGLVRRTAEATDRRAPRIMLTQEGLEAAELIEERLSPVRVRLFAGLSDDELTAAERLLAALDERLQNDMAAAS